VKLCSVLKHNYSWANAVTNRFSQLRQIALFAAALGCLLLGASTANAQSARLSKISCHSHSFSAAGTDACSVYLTGTTSSQVEVNLSSNNPAVTVTSHAWVTANKSTAGFNATVSSVTSAQMATITATAGGVSTTYSIQLNPSTSTPTPALTVNATSISFGAVSVNTQATQTVTLTSSGTASLTVNSAVVTGTGFSVSGSSFPVTLNPGQTLNLNLEFDPTAAGSDTGRLTITSNASSNPTASFALSGTGTATSHQVDLSWDAPSESSVAVVGYNVYRAPGGSTSYQRLNSSPVGSTNYTDSAVTGGQTYVYVVKSVDSAGTESAASNSTTATVPGS